MMMLIQICSTYPQQQRHPKCNGVPLGWSQGLQHQILHTLMTLLGMPSPSLSTNSMSLQHQTLIGTSQESNPIFHFSVFVNPVKRRRKSINKYTWMDLNGDRRNKEKEDHNKEMKKKKKKEHACILGPTLDIQFS